MPSDEEHFDEILKHQNFDFYQSMVSDHNGRVNFMSNAINFQSDTDLDKTSDDQENLSDENVTSSGSSFNEFYNEEPQSTKNIQESYFS